MSGENFFSGIFQPVVLNTQGQITCAAGYKAKFYEAATDIAKTIYTDPDLQVPYSTPSNIAYLDDTGKALIYLGVGGYKLVLTDPNDVPVPGWTIDNITGNGAFGTGFVNSFADLKDVNTSIFPYTYIGGYFTPGDGGEGMFYNQTSGGALDGGYVQESTFDPSKRWFRIPDEDGSVRAASFGFIPARAGIQSENLLAADSYAFQNSATLRIQAGTDGTVDGDIELTAPQIVMNEGAYFAAESGASILINGILIAGNWRVFSGFAAVTFANASQESRPEWFGAVAITGNPDSNATAFAEWKAAGAGVFVVPAGVWPHTGTFTPAANKLTLFYGSVGSRPAGAHYGLASRITGNLTVNTTGNATFAGDFEATGTGTIGGTLGVGGNLSVGGRVQASEYVRPTAGTSTQTFKAGGVVFSALTDTYTLPANALSKDHDSLSIEVASGKSDTTSASVTVFVSLGGQPVFSKTIASVTTGGIYLTMKITRLGSTSCAAGGVMTAGTASSADYKTPTVNFLANQNIIVTVSTSGGAPFYTPDTRITVLEAPDYT